MRAKGNFMASLAKTKDKRIVNRDGVHDSRGVGLQKQLAVDTAAVGIILHELPCVLEVESMYRRSHLAFFNSLSQGRSDFVK